MPFAWTSSQEIQRVFFIYRIFFKISSNLNPQLAKGVERLTINMQKYEKTFTACGKEIQVTSGNFGFRSDIALKVQQGETVVMIFVTVDSKDTHLDYFPLGINYMEKFYASGTISGSRFIKRERRPSEAATVKGRVIDRSVRPLFPAGFKRGVSVVINVMSYDGENDPAILGANAAAMAIHASSIPFFGPVSSVLIGMDEEENLLVNPDVSVMKTSKLNAVISSTKDAVSQLEIDGDQVSEAKMAEAFQLAFDEAQAWTKAMDEVREDIGNEKLEYAESKANMDLVEVYKASHREQISEALFDDENRNDRLKAIQNEIIEKFEEEKDEDSEITKGDIETALHYIEKQVTREAMLSGKRVSGREMNEIRELLLEATVLPRVHGSALFSRGKSQALSITTLGSLRLAQVTEGLDGEEEKTFMHHYVGPNYSFGDAGRFSFYAGNREIGHGTLGEKAIEWVMPSKEDFPYTVRVVSEVLSQQGSSSMAATCGATLALMDAGVPITAPVAGISLGLITHDESQEKYQLLTDVQDVEDFYGDMDLKVAGTEKGITAIQMDTKLKGVKVNILQEGLGQAKEARQVILDKYKEILTAPRTELSEHAPRVKKMSIKKDRIGELIGPGGKVIKAILESVENKVDVNIEDDGTIVITSVFADLMEKVVTQIGAITEEPEIGKIYTGKVAKIMDFGAFVDVSPSISGLVHVSELADGFVKDVTSVVSEGQEVKVKLVSIDDRGRLKLSMKQAIPKEESN